MHHQNSQGRFNVCLLARISTGKIYDAFRSYLNVLYDEVGEYFLLNSVMCIFIFENRIVDGP